MGVRARYEADPAMVGRSGSNCLKFPPQPEFPLLVLAFFLGGGDAPRWLYLIELSAYSTCRLGRVFNV